MLQQHFIHWKNAHYPDNTFYEDGIINEVVYEKQSTKILFIAKEPNGSNHTEQNGRMSFCEEWRSRKPTYVLAMRIAEWSVGLLNNFPVFDTITPEMKYAHLQKIAFMNVKKSRGVGKTSDVKGLNRLVKEQLDYIHRQIEWINPDLVMLGLSQSKVLRNYLFPKAEHEWKPSGYDVQVAKTAGRILVDFYHPSSRNAPAAAYCLLKNVIDSINHTK